ncbi:MAG: hypothetical protein ACJ735_01735 [Actinomycetes bacterium]
MHGFRPTRRRLRVAGLALATGVATLATFLALPATPSHATGPKALILGTTVSSGTATDGSAESLEQQQAELDGFTVTVVDQSTWASMSASDFAQYQVIILGDPDCGSLSEIQPAIDNASVWQSVVMASGGNRALIGTDSTLHDSGAGGSRRGDLLAAKGIAYAGAVPDATGVYLSLSCYYDYGVNALHMPLPWLDGLTGHGPNAFVVSSESALGLCAGAISIVAQSGPTDGLHDADLADWGCSVHEFFDAWPSDFVPLALATDAPPEYTANDVDTGNSVSGSPYILVAGGGLSITSDISLTPETGTQAIGTNYIFTATVLKDGAPQAGKSVTFTVESGPDVGTMHTDTTDSNGQTTFTLNGAAVGTDNVSATFTDDAGNLQEDFASVTWTGEMASACHFKVPEIHTGQLDVLFCTGYRPNGHIRVLEDGHELFRGFARPDGTVKLGFRFRYNTVGIHTFTVIGKVPGGPAQAPTAQVTVDRKSH